MCPNIPLYLADVVEIIGDESRAGEMERRVSHASEMREISSTNRDTPKKTQIEG